MGKGGLVANGSRSKERSVRNSIDERREQGLDVSDSSTHVAKYMESIA